MKVLTFRLGQFAVSALFLTILFLYALNLCIEVGSGAIFCSIVYFCLMFFIGYFLGKKDVIENDIHDIGFRFHFTTYVICIGISFGAYYIGWNAQNLVSMKISAICWVIGLLIHFICFLFAQRKAIKGYAKEDIFE
ncbi:MAG: hypothetical protein UHE93_04050 [Muribaculaceae bacterium]|nr:hypothetical protein [Muribaculaceae bacterium]